MKKRRLFLSLICAMLMITGLFGVANQVSAEIQSTIRVYLRRLRVTNTLNLTIHGEYMTSDGKTVFSDGTNMTIVIRGNQLVLHSGGIVTAMGDKMELIRCQSEHERQGVTIAGNDGLYEGDLSLDIDSGVIRPILSIHVEDYLLGVVPFEMGDSFPLEALKAQALPHEPMRSGRAVLPVRMTLKILQTIRHIGDERRIARCLSRRSKKRKEFAASIAVRWRNAFILPAMAGKPNWGSMYGRHLIRMPTVTWTCATTHMILKTKRVPLNVTVSAKSQTRTA